jgi:NADH:ubiquinone oxidoreductase subunit 2 (subunit N)
MAADWLTQIWGLGPRICLLLLGVAAGVAIATPWTRVAWMVATLAATSAAIFSVGFAANGAAGIYNQYLVAVIGVTSALALLACGSVLDSLHPKAGPLTVALALVACMGWTGALLADDLIAFFAAVEAAWLSVVALVALEGRRRGGLNASLRLLMVGGASSGLCLLGAALLGAAAGSLRFDMLNSGLRDGDMSALAGATLVVVSLAMKMGVAPFSYWVVAAYGRASPFALVIVAAPSALGALAALMHFSSLTFRAPELGGGMSATLAAIGMLAVVIGSLQAVGAKDVRRLFAYAWASQAGMAILCVALGSQAGLSAALIQITAIAAAALAFAVGLAVGVGDRSDIADLDGLVARAPLASAAMAAAVISLMGTPLTIGFLGRWRLVEVGVGVGWWWVTIAVIITSLAGVFYGGRLIGRMYLRRSETVTAPVTSIWRWVAAPALLAAIATVVVGASPGLLLRAADFAAAQVFTSPP